MLVSTHTAPGTSLVTTAETLAANVPATPFYAGGPGGGATGVSVKGSVNVTTGATVTSVTVKLRTGQNNTTTGQVDVSETDIAAASLANVNCPFDFVDATLPVGTNLQNSGYSITVTQNGATGNGTVNAVDFEVDRSPA